MLKTIGNIIAPTVLPIATVFFEENKPIKKVKIINFLLNFLKLFITINNENCHLPKLSIWKRGFESNTADRYFIIFVLINFSFYRNIYKI